ncbi:SDR family NAD(P)-dependent oxidoreductase [Cupriavidus basilensis]|uniref:SDR family NAD(P)-dependent oxidoreductase n=1 Tax=Cupriavidus basilensis TaxID=68895 RepID=UPI00283F1FA2|nr:SDR family oxidoreductase [Cupriavidus basilensis]MDR3380211.1 SDR family NAD(P)-dependent oxidoreductase [Cupriavidus basilensis]
MASTSAAFGLSGKVGVITGATGAFGRAAAHSLADAGARLVIAGANAQALRELEVQLNADGIRVKAKACRPDTEANARNLIDEAVAQFGAIDFVVVGSGTNDPAPIQDMTTEQWDHVMAANVRGSWLVCKAFATHCIEMAQRGRVVLLSSTRGKLGLAAGYSAYCPSKAAIDGLTRTLACELGRYGINVNAIAPTVFRSELTAWMFADDDRGRAAREGMLARIPLGRLGEPEDLVGALQFLLSRASEFCTGQTLYIDGGYTAG